MTPDAALIAAAAVNAVGPYLAEAGKEAAKTLGKAGAEAALNLLRWLRKKLAGRAGEALAKLEGDPASEDNRADLRKQLAKMLEADPALMEELRALLPPRAVTDNSMTQTLSGPGAKGAQIRGTKNTVTM